MKEEILKRAMFAMPLSKEARSSGIMSGFDLDEMEADENQDMEEMPAMARTLTYVKGLHPLNKKGFAFGSYGWAEKGATLVDNVLTEMGVEKVMPPLTVRFRPDAKILQVCREAGVKLGQIAAQS